MSNQTNTIIIEDLQERMSELAQVGAISRGDVSDFEQYLASGDLEEAQELVAHLESVYRPSINTPFVTDDGLLDILRGDELDVMEHISQTIEIKYIDTKDDKILVKR